MIGNYKLQKLIGAGSFSTVYSALNVKTNTEVAIKIIPRNQESEIVFKAEIETLKKLDHPLINPVFDVIQDDMNYYIVMELLQSMTLLDLINQSKRLSEDMARKYFVQLVIALEYLHKTKHIIHRDLKLENIAIDSNQAIRLIDFGLSKQFSNENEHLKTLCGSVDYASPEILRGETYNALADIWSLGVVLYAMVSGLLPFSGNNVPETMNNILNSEPAYFSSLSNPLVDLLKRLLVKDPNSRIGIEEIKKHPWFLIKNIYVEEEFELLNSNRLKIFVDGNIDQSIVKILNGYNINSTFLVEKLQKFEFDEASSAYRILKRNMINNEMNKCLQKFFTDVIVTRIRSPPAISHYKSNLPSLDNSNQILSPTPRPKTTQLNKRISGKRDFFSLNFNAENISTIANFDINSQAKNGLKTPKIRRRLLHPNNNTYSNTLFSPTHNIVI